MTDRSVAMECLKILLTLQRLDNSFSWLDKIRSNNLKVKDLELIESGEKKLYVIEPQTYDVLSLLDSDHWMVKNNYFYENNNLAVSGSGSDEWIVADNKLLALLKTIMKKYKKKKSTKKKKTKKKTTKKRRRV